MKPIFAAATTEVALIVFRTACPPCVGQKNRASFRPDVRLADDAAVVVVLLAQERAETRAAFADRSKPLRGELRLDLGCPQRLGEPASPPFRSTSPTWNAILVCN